MANIESFKYAKHTEHEGEVIKWSCLANRTQNSWRAVGGRLFVTDKRILFKPHLFDYIFAGKKWYANLEDIKSIGMQEKGGDIFGGGLRNRLKIILKDGTEELFVVNSLDEVLEKLKNECVNTMLDHE